MSLDIKNWHIQIKKGYLDLIILKLIAAEGQTYGFQFISKLEELDISLKEGTLYPLLSRMTKDGLLRAKWETKDIQGHPRKFYSLTKSGIKSLSSMKDVYENMFEIYKKVKNIGDEND